MLPERSHYFDVGVDQKYSVRVPISRQLKDCYDLDLGIDAYYKIATDLDRQWPFRPGLTCSAPSIMPKEYVEGVELSAKFRSGNFQAYANLAVGAEKATNAGVEPISVRQARRLPISAA